ncbi:MAG: signal peptidase I [Corynebacterium sp.]|nr:signal peptidase I [Corynebacterium sp.]
MTQISKASLWRYLSESLLIIGMAFIMLVVTQALVGRMYVVPSASMEPTLHGCAGCSNDRIVVEKLSYLFSSPQRGDVVVFEGTDSWNVGFTVERSQNVIARGVQNLAAGAGLMPNTENILVKRVVATEGDIVQCLEGDETVLVNGHKTKTSFLQSPPDMVIGSDGGSQACGGKYFGPLEVPKNSLFVMGDNRTNSLDSRYHLGDMLQGTIPESSVRGKVRAVVYPRLSSVPREEILIP